MLQSPQRYPELKTNHELAQKLAALLDEQVTAGDDAEAAVTKRNFLCTALGEFHVDDGLGVLLKAARRDPQRDVRRRAVNAVAVLAGALGELKPPQYLKGDELVEALTALADDPDELIRSETAFALGVAAAGPDADPRLVAKLEELADDPYTDARFNAAVGLARLGNPRAGAALAEMLDAESIAASLSGEKAMTEEVSAEELRRQKAYKRNSIISNALSAIKLLLNHEGLPEATLEQLDGALTRFIASAPQIADPAPIAKEQLEAARQTLEQVRAARGAAAPAAS
jgi:HEAT repeat protein